MRPLVSCLMPTMGTRIDYALQAIRDFQAQDYDGPLELLISIEEPDAAALETRRQAIEPDPHRRVSLVPVPAGTLLGPKRNVLMDKAKGSYFCQWDDDDRYHPSRVRFQEDALARDVTMYSCCLRECLYHTPARGVLHWVDWGTGPSTGTGACMPGTILHRRTRERYPASGPQAARNEDTAFFQILSRRGPATALASRPYLYLRTLHQTNNSGSQRMQRNTRVHGVPDAQILRCRSILETAVRELPALVFPLAMHSRTDTPLFYITAS